jgi:hypothetical protein
MQYSAVVFLSESYHGVTDIESGHREMFTNELWEYDDPPWPQVRPRPQYMELFLERCKETNPNDVEWPSWEEVQEWLEENGREPMDDTDYGNPQANDEDESDDVEDENEDFEDEGDENEDFEDEGDDFEDESDDLEDEGDREL